MMLQVSERTQWSLWQQDTKSCHLVPITVFNTYMLFTSAEVPKSHKIGLALKKLITIIITI